MIQALTPEVILISNKMSVANEMPTFVKYLSFISLKKMYITNMFEPKHLVRKYIICASEL